MSEIEDNFKKQLAEIDDRIVQLKNDIQLGEDLESLHKDERFQRVILHGYFEVEAERIFGMLVNPSGFKRDQLENLMDKMSAIRNYKQFFATLLINANMAPEQIEDEEGFRKQVTADNSPKSEEG
jgi:hypothetical protein